MHQSWLKNHMCVLGWISRSHARNGNQIQTSWRRDSAENIEKLGFKIHVNPKLAWKWWNLAWCHVMTLTCCVKKITIWNKFWYKLLANRSFSQEGSWFWEGTCHLCVHNSNLKYKHMFQCTKVSWKITCVSSGKFLGSMQEMGMKFKILGVVAGLETLRNLVF